jgi:hypothetical protein
MAVVAVTGLWNGPMNMKKVVSPILSVVLAYLAGSTGLSAAVLVVTNPGTFTGSEAINPLGRTLTVASGATPESTLEALPGFSAIHDFAFSGNQSTANEYVFDFTSINAVDVRLRYTDSPSTGQTVGVSNITYSTSSSSTFRIAANNSTSTVGLRIDFGTYDADLDVFTADKAVQAMAFTLPTGSATVPVTIQISYFDAANTLLSTQSFTTSTSGNTYGYTGYQSTGAPIAYALLSYTTAGAVPVVTLDDLSFAPVPEPRIPLLLVSAAAMFLFFRRRPSAARVS